MPESFVEQLFFLSIREAQRIIDRRYPGWYIKMNAHGISRIYNQKGQIQWTIGNGKRIKH